MNRKLIWKPRGLRAYIGYALALVAAVGSALFCREEAAFFALGVASALGLGFAGALKLSGGGRSVRAAEGCWYVLALFAIFLAGQLSMNHGVAGMGLPQILMNLATAALPFLLLLAIAGRPRLALIAVWAMFLLLAVANYCVYLFRGMELTPADIRTAGTGFSVASNYKFRISGGFFASLCLWALILFSTFCLPGRAARPRARALALVAMVIVLCGWVPACRNLKLQSYADEDTAHRGLFASFGARLVGEFQNPMPEGYSPERVAELEARYQSAEDADAQVPADAPDIIVIMDESFVDMGALNPESEIGEASIPFFRSLRENAVRGSALVSVYGGGTVHSEYEFLTGNALERLPQRTSVYARYLNAPARSLATELKRRGYAVEATHPFLAGSYDRNRAYPLLGFDEVNFLDAYPREDLIRAFVSDREMFRFIIDRYERRDASKPCFLFGITMQNHGGYGYEGPNEAPRFDLSGFSGNYPEAEQYLGLLRESDDALKMLIEHFEQVDSPVLIAFFGDHFPNLESGFYRELHGGALDDLADWQLTRAAPFAIWTNYDIPEWETGLISLSNLAGYLYEAAGLELPAYDRFLRDLSEVIPAMNALGYYSAAEGKFLPYEEAGGEEAQWLSDYAILQYNSLFDAEHRSELFFPAAEEASAN